MDQSGDQNGGNARTHVEDSGNQEQQQVGMAMKHKKPSSLLFMPYKAVVLHPPSPTHPTHTPTHPLLPLPYVHNAPKGRSGDNISTAHTNVHTRIRCTLRKVSVSGICDGYPNKV